MELFNNFFKKRKSTPEFEFITSYEFKDHYFARSKKWTWINSDQISLIEKDDNGNIKLTTLEYWFQEMFLDANGQITIAEYLNILVKQFQDSQMDIPSDLDVFMTETLWSLKSDLNAIRFSNSPIALEPKFKDPLDKDSK